MSITVWMLHGRSRQKIISNRNCARREQVCSSRRVHRCGVFDDEVLTGCEEIMRKVCEDFEVV
jgi:hypothetical protein